MLQLFTIKNFRCFPDLTLKSLERVNLVAGKNNVGKTALLEALFLHLGPDNPSLAVNINLFRGMERITPKETLEMWGWLFFEKQILETIELTSLDEVNARRSLRMRLQEPKKVQLREGTKEVVVTGDLMTTESWQPELMLEYEDEQGQIVASRASIEADGLKVERAKIPPRPTGIFLTQRVRFPKIDAERFSDLERLGRQDEVLHLLRELDPRIHRLAILVTGGEPLIHADIGIRELIPLPYMGEGIVRLLSIMLAILSVPGGVVLIDEIENGLHHSVMVKVWRAIALTARQSQTQIFTTTHSWECIQSAHEAFSTDEVYDFRLHRLERVREKIEVISYDQEALRGAMTGELEVR